MVPETLIEQIYEASFLPELWPGILDRLSALIDAEGGWFMAIAPERIRWTGSEAFAGGLRKWAENGWLARTDRVRRGIRAQHPGFLTETDLYGPGELETDQFYRRFLWKVGLGWGAGTVITSPTVDTLLLTLERRQERGPVEAEYIKLLDELRPHLARSALLSARLSLQQARVISETLASIRLPALVFDATGRVLAANSLIEALTPFVQWRAQGKVALSDRHANELWQASIAAVAAGHYGSVQSFAVRDETLAPTLVAHVLPVRGDARDIFDRCLGILMLTPVTMANAPPLELLQSLFDLTAAEARVARRIASGDTIADIASDGGLSRNTIKTHVRLVMEKTGCERQAEIAALLGGIARPLG